MLIPLIVEKINAIKPRLMEAGIKEITITKYIFPERLERYSQEDLEKIFAWAINLEPLITKIQALWIQLPTTVWEHYDLMGENEIYEQVKMKQFRKELKDAWKTRPIPNKSQVVSE